MTAQFFAEDGDAPFALQVVGIQNQAVLPAGQLVELLVAVEARLIEHLVDQRGLAVVDVGDDGHVAQVGDGNVKAGARHSDRRTVNSS